MFFFFFYFLELILLCRDEQINWVLHKYLSLLPVWALCVSHTKIKRKEFLKLPPSHFSTNDCALGIGCRLNAFEEDSRKRTWYLGVYV